MGEDGQNLGERADEYREVAGEVADQGHGLTGDVIPEAIAEAAAQACMRRLPERVDESVGEGYGRAKAAEDVALMPEFSPGEQGREWQPDSGSAPPLMSRGQEEIASETDRTALLGDEVDEGEGCELIGDLPPEFEEDLEFEEDIDVEGGNVEEDGALAFEGGDFEEEGLAFEEQGGEEDGSARGCRRRPEWLSRLLDDEDDGMPEMSFSSLDAGIVCAWVPFETGLDIGAWRRVPAVGDTAETLGPVAESLNAGGGPWRWRAISSLGDYQERADLVGDEDMPEANAEGLATASSIVLEASLLLDEGESIPDALLGTVMAFREKYGVVIIGANVGFDRYGAGAAEVVLMMEEAAASLDAKTYEVYMGKVKAAVCALAAPVIEQHVHALAFHLARACEDRPAMRPQVLSPRPGTGAVRLGDSHVMVILRDGTPGGEGIRSGYRRAAQAGASEVVGEHMSFAIGQAESGIRVRDGSSLHLREALCVAQMLREQQATAQALSVIGHNVDALLAEADRSPSGEGLAERVAMADVEMACFAAAADSRRLACAPDLRAAMSEAARRWGIEACTDAIRRKIALAAVLAGR